MVATTVALSFISFWKAAAIVLSDLVSTMFYIGGITEQEVGKSAPWMVIAVMLFSYAVRSVYMESCGMFVRGGVYVVVRDSIGPTVAKLSVSSLVVDYVLTGPISAVSAGQYLGRLLNDFGEKLGHFHTDPNWFSVYFSVATTIYFWWSNIKGVPESSAKALRIMQITTVMVGILLIWCPLTILINGRWQLPPAPKPSNLVFSEAAQGWLKDTFWLQIPMVAVIIAFGHSLLSMSGFETLAQVYREIEQPKVQNLQRAGMVIFAYSLVFTALVSFFATAIIPDDVRPKFYDNLISGLAMHLVGPPSLRLLFQSFVVVVGFLILAGAANTAIVGSNGVLNGTLLSW